MAKDHDSAQEPSQPPSERRLRQALAEGQVPRSRELVMACQLLAFCLLVLAIVPGVPYILLELCSLCFQLHGAEPVTPGSVVDKLVGAGKTLNAFTLPMLAISVGATILGSLITGGVIFSPKAIRPKWQKLNPIIGLKRIFSFKLLPELIKALCKTVIFLTILLLFLYWMLPEMIRAGQKELHPAIAALEILVSRALISFTAGALLIGIIDAIWQLYRYQRSLMMTQQEVKEDLRHEEGSPQTRERIRRMQKEQRNRRMLQSVPTADIIITNPDHVAVALKYDLLDSGSQAPVLVAKGGDLLARKIIEIARQASRPVICQPVVARAVYYHTELNHQIPVGLYTAVARVMAYVYLLEEHLAGRRPEPPTMMDISVPEQYWHP